MAWDVERTKRLLLEAATEEFSARGLAGARVDRIAVGAGVNKERIYQYFGSKDGLFAAVLAHELELVMDAVSVRGPGIAAIADYAGRVFDYHLAHPHLARLTFWEGLERGEPIGEGIRRERADAKVAMFREAVPELGEDDVRDLLLTILTLCDGYPSLPTMERIYTGADGGGAARRRAAIVATVDAAARSALAR